MIRLEKIFGVIGLALVVIILAGCNNVRGIKLLMPEYFGLVSIDENVYIEAEADEEEKLGLSNAVVVASEKVYNA